ncbi:MAG: transcription termination/antitermination protein NusG [Microbacterium sp.]|uniref:Transcription termination/antitermination protein NusG n=1 Tax=Microbacterium natoriense TaxID=284570 RepID=A0AAW8F3Y6_9MICO|nr:MULTISPECIES: transcription termination/antitermination protein NusG [Microbacterium]MBW8763692.1 transcription termination/antitermination protein NusG [Microbacterium sp.]MDQ0649262.1 transcriptional antiterminator NusG [Microbacterium natoriense]
MSERYSDDADWATAAEQSSEEDEAQEGNVLAAEEFSVTSAEHVAIHIEDEDADEDGADDDIDIDDPEADAIVNDALNLDEAAESEAAAEVLNDSVAEEAADFEAAAASQVAPYDGPDVNGDEDEPVLDPAEVAEIAAAADVVDEVEASVDAADAAEPDDDAEEDPYEAFRADLRMLPGKWYVIHSYAGFERKVKANIEQRKSTLEVEDEIYQIEVPMEDVVEIKNGQRKMVNRVRIPGYVLVRMELNEDTWSVVRHTPGVTGFVGNAHNPTPLRFEEAFNMLKALVEVKDVPTAKNIAAKGGVAVARPLPAEVDFEIGETITIKEGSFAGLPGSISEIKPESGKLTVLVSLFERETPVELSFDQVTKMI